MANIDTYEVVSMARGYHQYQSQYVGLKNNRFHCLIIGNLFGNNGITSERVLLGRGSVDAVGTSVGLKYSVEPFLKRL